MADIPDKPDIFSFIGRAITEWAFFESQLCRIFVVCLSPTDAHRGCLHMFDPQTSEAAFYAVENFRSKLSMVDAAIQQRFKFFANKEEILGPWSKLHDKARRLSRRRNALAHWNVVGRYGEEKLIPHYQSPAGQDYIYGRKRGLSAHDIRQLGRAFLLLGERTHEVARLMAAHPELHGKFAKLVARQLETARYHQNQTGIERLESALSSPE